MKEGKIVRKRINEPEPIDPELLDEFVVAIIEALKQAKDKYAVAEVKNVTVNNDLITLLTFVGIDVKQFGTTALFAWSDTVNLNDVAEGEFRENNKKEDRN